MGEFFKGWRRKLGVVTLVLACLFMGIWINSLIDHQAYSCFSSHCTWESFNSLYGKLAWGHHAYSEDQLLSPGRHSYNLFDPTSAAESEIEWRWHWCGIGAGRLRVGETIRSKTELLFIPYWSIVFPLTLLSTYLLLVKPRTPAPKATVEPKTPEGT